VRSSEITGLLLEMNGQPISDCSDSVYRCIRAGNHTLAIPKSGIKPKSRYSKESVAFVVEDCLREVRGICLVATISARCGKLDPYGKCLDAERVAKVGVKFGNVDYFVYNEDFGITAFGSTDRLLNQADERRAVASEMMLVGEHGIFSPDLSCGVSKGR
jgi:hypothetical protein